MLLASLVQGLIGLRFLLALGVALPGTLLGARLGALVYHRLDDRRFDRIVLVAAAGCRGWPGMVETAERTVIFPVACWRDKPRPGRACNGGTKRMAAASCAVWICWLWPHLLSSVALPALRRSRAGRQGGRRARPRPRRRRRSARSGRVCAVALCSTLHNRKPDTGDVTCSVQKTWRKEVLIKILPRGKLSWPWGYARCMTELKFDRATLVKAHDRAGVRGRSSTQARHPLRAGGGEGEVRGQAGDPAQGHLQGRKGREGEPELGQDRSADAGQDRACGRRPRPTTRSACCRAWWSRTSTISSRPSAWR